MGLVSPLAWQESPLLRSDSCFKEQQLSAREPVPGWSLLSEEHGGLGGGKSEEGGLEIHLLASRGRGMNGASEL